MWLRLEAGFGEVSEAGCGQRCHSMWALRTQQGAVHRPGGPAQRTRSRGVSGGWGCGVAEGPAGVVGAESVALLRGIPAPRTERTPGPSGVPAPRPRCRLDAGLHARPVSSCSSFLLTLTVIVGRMRRGDTYFYGCPRVPASACSVSFFSPTFHALTHLALTAWCSVTWRRLTSDSSSTPASV